MTVGALAKLELATLSKVTRLGQCLIGAVITHIRTHAHRGSVGVGRRGGDLKITYVTHSHFNLAYQKLT